MPYSNFPHGITSFGVPVFGNGGGPLGLGCGKVRYVVTARETTNLYYNRLRNVNGIKDADIYTTVTDAYNATTSGQNDVVAVTPGAYDEAAEIAWSNANTHLVGLSGPNTMGDYYEPGVVIYTDATDVASVITITGQNTQFYNVAIQNAGNNAACLTALTVNKYACYFENVSLMGMMTTNQNTTAAAAALYIGTDGHTAQFNNCVIGQDVWGTRSGANSGVIRFTGSQPNDGIFRNCVIRSISSTASAAAVAVATGTGIGRGWLFDNCSFINFNSTQTILNQVFYAPTTGAWWPVHLHSCYAFGWDRWTDNSVFDIMADMPQADAGGGLAIEQSVTVANGS